MKSKQLSRNIYIFTGTILVFAIGYYLYMEVYTRNKEANIVATKSRILEQMSQNLKEKVGSMKSNAGEYVKYLNEKKQTEADLELMLKEKTDISYFNPDLEFIGIDKSVTSEQAGSVDVTAKARPDYLNFYVSLIGTFDKANTKKIEFRSKYESLMAGFLQRNIFNEYILISDSQILFSTLPGKPSLVISNLPPTQTQSAESGSAKISSPVNIDVLNKENDKQTAIKGVTTYDITISNNPYKLFICQTLINNETVYFCGLVQSELIDQAKKAMAPWLIILLSMILALIILGLPFIKLKVMSATEQLTSGNLLNSAVSLFLGICFIILFIFFATNSYWFRKQNETKLSTLAKEINDSFNTEIKSAWDQLNFYDSLQDKKVSHPFRPSDRENILVKKPGDTIHELFRPSIYPYFDYSFYLDSTGYQIGMLTPFPVRDKSSNLSARDYFNKPDEWIYPFKNTNRFRMESIVSVTSGVVKAAVSKRSKIDDMVIAMTGRFYSIIDPIMPKAYKFCIIDKSGLVWFHSDKLRNMQENFVTECKKDVNLKAAIYANAAKTLDVHYYDEPYRIHIEALDPVPLYLVTMYDKHLEYAYQVQVFMLTLLLFSTMSLFLIIQIVTLFLCKHVKDNPGWKNLVMDFLSAKEGHNKIYLVMSIMLVLIGFFYLLFIDPLNIVVPLLSVLALFSWLFPYLNLALNDFSFKSSGVQRFAAANLVFLVLVNMVSYQLMRMNDFLCLIGFQVFILSLFIAGYLKLKKDFQLKNKKYNINYYVFFLMGLLLVYCVAPSIKLFDASVSHEIIREVKHSQMELSRLRESRNLKLKNYYSLMEKDHHLNKDIELIFEDRLDKGIYSRFAGSAFNIEGKPGWIKKEVTCKDFDSKITDNQEVEYIINNFRPVYDRTSIETKYLENNSLMKGTQSWTLCDDYLVFNYSSISEKYKSNEPDSCQIVSSFSKPDIFNPLVADSSSNTLFENLKYKFLFILFLLLVGFALYHLILFGIRRLFGISIIEMHTEYDFGNFLGERIKTGQSVMVIGSPSVDPAKFVKEILQPENELIIRDFSKTEPETHNPEDMNKLLILENFAIDYYSSNSLELQLGKINEYIRQKCRIVIISSVAPYMIEEFLEQKMNPGKNEKPDENSLKSEQLLLSFRNILAYVNLLYTPERYDLSILQPECFQGSVCNRIRTDYSGNQDKSLKCLICRELGVSTYLHRYALEVMKFHDDLVKAEIPEPIMKERILSRIMDLSRLYYDNILRSCTPMERFVLNDMAHDMIVNSKNQKVVQLLIHRGLFLAGGCTIKFMNESFREHVMLRFTKEERALLKAKLGDSGMSWQGYKLVLVLVMIGLFTFLFIANKSVLDNLNKLFIVLGGGTVLITNLTGLLTRKESGSGK